MNMRIVDHTAAALNEIRDRIRNSPEYKATRETVVQHVARRVKDKSVAEMRMMGGFSGIITDAIAMHAHRDLVGSGRILWSAFHEMMQDRAKIRTDAQRLNNTKP